MTLEVEFEQGLASDREPTYSYVGGTGFQVCSWCGAMVYDAPKHTTWHLVHLDQHRNS